MGRRVTVAAIAAAGLAAGGIAAAMLLAGPGTIGLVVAGVLSGVQVALLVGVRRGAVGTRRFLLAWSAEAGLTYAVAGDPGTGPAIVYLGVGLVFAAVVVAGLAAMRRVERVEDAVREERGDTRPLPVVDGD